MELGWHRVGRGRLVQVVAAILVCTLAFATATAAEFREGVDYVELPVPVETRDPSKIEVVEVFSYACIHCYNLEPVVARWRPTLSDDVDFYRLHLVTRPLEPYARAFFTAEAMGILERVHMPMFAQIHEYNMDMRRSGVVGNVFARYAGVDEEEFMRVYDSFGVQSRVRQADARGRMYRIMATPSVVVNGRYVTESGRAGLQGMFAVVNHLIELERAARANAEAPADD